MIKAVIFDLFNTLTFGGCDPEERIREKYRLARDYHFVEKFVCGTKFVDKESYFKTVIKGIGLSYTPENIKDIVAIFETERKKEKIHPDAEKVLTEFKSKGYKIGLISNIANPDFDLIAPSSLKKYFDAIIFSYEIGIIKPDPKIFELCLQKLNAQPSETLIIGNSFKSDIMGAKALGINGILIAKEKPDFSKTDIWPYAMASELADVIKIAENYSPSPSSLRLAAGMKAR